MFRSKINRKRSRNSARSTGFSGWKFFGSAARGEATPESDVDLLVSFSDSQTVSTSELLEMAGEAEELIGLPVDFVLRDSVERSPNTDARQAIFDSVKCLYAA